ncbi:unnamed protein product [Nesidiocoris tenuis]|nr:unnamed protein product [Nesidiocoris tenuis]
MSKYSEMYSGKLILAPMVRIGTLPMRLLALENGADLVYTEELIDWKLLRSFRRENPALGTVDFVDRSDGTVIFRTCEKERGRVILQIGTSNPDRAFQVARLIENDVAGIDINMGCPKEFSVKGGMGVALLSKVDNAKAILKKLVSSIRRPITCKIRVFQDEEKTLQLCKDFESCGIAAIAVHGRTKDERPQHSNRNDLLKKISQLLTIPVIANGGSREIETYDDILKFRKATGCSSVMVARSAEWNASVFRKRGKLPLDTMIRSYLKLAIDYDNSPSNTKYCIQNMLRELQESELGKKFLETQTLGQMSELWDLGDYYREVSAKLDKSGLIGRRDVVPIGYKKPCLDDTVEMECAFIRSLYMSDPDLPKTKLLNWASSKGYKKPVYQTVQIDKLFKAVVLLNEKKYTSSFW